MYDPYHEMDIRQFVDKLNEMYRNAKPETNLKTLRTLANLSQSELAAQTGISVRTLQQYVIALANVVVQTNINDFGALAQAGCGAYSKIEGFGFLPITSFTLALTTFIGQNLGAQEYERAKKGARFGLIACVSIAEAIGLAIYAFIPALIAMFIQSGDVAQVQEVIRLGTLHARIMTPFYFLLALSNAMAAVLRGAGRSIVPMIVMLCCWCVFRVTYITIAVPIWPELTTISWAYPITWGLSSIIFLIYYNVVDWVHAYGRSKPRKMT